MPKSKKPVKSAQDQSAWLDKQRQAIEFVKEGQPSAALKVYEDLERDYPNDPKVMVQLVNSYYSMGNLSKYEAAIRRLVELEGPRVDSTYGLGGAYRSSGRRALSLRTYQEFIKRWPEDSRAENVKEVINVLEQDLFKQALNIDLSYEVALDLFSLTDEVRFYLDHQNLPQARSVAKRLLRRKQDFIPGMALMVQIDSMEGKLAEALALGERMLALDPQNLQSLNSLVRLNFLTGRMDEAKRLGELLKAAPRTISGAYTLVAEGLAFLEDDQGMMELLADAMAGMQPATPLEDAGFYHMVAVSFWHVGLEDKARELWERALTKASYFSWAKENLAESNKPAAERGAIWAFPFDYWLLGPVTDEISGLIRQSFNLDMTKAMLTGFINEKHPEIITLAPHLIYRGDRRSRDFVVRIAALSGHNDLVDAAQLLISAQAWPYAERLQGAELLVQTRIINPGPFRLWLNGQWVERLVMPFDVDPTPAENRYPPEVSELAIKASQALAEQDGVAAQAAIEQALELAPGDPLLLNNLGLAYELQDQDDKAEAMFKEVLARNPADFFATIGMVRLAIGKDEIPEARAMLAQLSMRPMLHLTEFSALCMAEIETCLAEVDRVNATLWLDLWERKDPENPSIAEYRKAIEPSKGKRKNK